MKKGRVMLTAVVVFTVVGGALAHKAKNFPQRWCVDGPTDPEVSVYWLILIMALRLA
jgi:hypothetical protein